MTLWDVFHSDRLEVERGLDGAGVRDAFARGDLTEDDLIRPAGTGTPWERLADRPDLLTAPDVPAEPPEVPTVEPPAPYVNHPTEIQPIVAPSGPFIDHPTEMNTELHDRLEWSDEDEPDYEHVDPELSQMGMLAFADEPDSDSELEILDDDEPPPPPVSSGPILPPLDKSVAIPVPGPAPLPWDESELEAEFDGEDEYDPLEEDESAAEFTLARASAETVEELDLAAMVDVAFQLVLFFLVTATTVLYKSLEVPKPNADAPPDSVVQGRTKTLDDFAKEYILVEMDVSGAIKIDRQPVPGPITMLALAERLRTLRIDTGRKAMLFSADFYTPHHKAVLAYDAANEASILIKTAKPSGGTIAIPPAIIKKG